MMKTKIVSAMILVLLLLVSSLGTVMAGEVDAPVNLDDGQGPADLPVNWGGDNDVVRHNLIVHTVEVDNDELVTGRPTRESYDRGDLLDIEVKLEATAVVENIVVAAWISGDEHSPLVEVSETFDMEPEFDANGVLLETERETVDLEIEIPTTIDIDDSGKYQLHILVTARDNVVKAYNFPLKIKALKHSMRIKDIIVSPSHEVVAGRGFAVFARVENLGQRDEEVKVTAGVPELGSAVVNSDHIDTLENGDSANSPDIFLRVPADAMPGVYDLVVEVEYDDRSKKETAVTQIEVVNPNFAMPGTEPATPRATGRTVVQVGPEMQEVTKGQGGAIYPVSLTNEGSEAKTYVIGVSGVESFATVQVSPNNVVVVEPSESESVYVYVSAREDAQVGAHSFTVDIKSADKTLQQVPLMANVLEGADNTDSLKRGLEIGLIVLVVILIILGLIIAFTKARKSDDEEEALAGQTYY